MTLAFWFWLFYVLSIFFVFFYEYTPGVPFSWRRGPWYFLIYVLVGLLGWKVFGSPVQ